MTDTSIHGSAADRHSHTQSRKCPHCGTKITWKDFTGLATQSWHFTGYLTAQQIISTRVREEIESPTMPNYFQKCGYCEGDVSAVQMR